MKNCRPNAALPMLALAMLLPMIPSGLRAAIAVSTFGVADFWTLGSSVQQGASGAESKSSDQQNGTDQSHVESAMHSITLQFDYDFTETPACSANVKAACVQKFRVYDISGGKPYFLFAVPVPQNAHGVMKGITATSPRMLFAVGKHRIGVSAQMADGKESPPRECKTIIEIKPGLPAAH